MQNDQKYSVDLDSPVAVYVQLENQVQFAIASGRLKPSDMLPSVRDMSVMLDINPNTVTKAYRDLELLQLVNTRRGVGVMVASKAPRLCKAKSRAMVQDHLLTAVSESQACGMTEAEIRALVEQGIKAKQPPYIPKKRR